MTWKTSWESHMEPANAFLQKNWWWDGSQWNMCHVFWLTTKSSSASVCVVIFKSMFRMIQLSLQRSSQETRHGFMGTTHGQSSSPLVHHKFDPQGQNINHHFYKGVLQHLWEANRLKCQGKWCIITMLLLTLLSLCNVIRPRTTQLWSTTPCNLQIWLSAI